MIRASIGTRKIDIPKGGPNRVIESAESIRPRFSPIYKRFTLVKAYPPIWAQYLDWRTFAPVQTIARVLKESVLKSLLQKYQETLNLGQFKITSKCWKQFDDSII